MADLKIFRLDGRLVLLTGAAGHFGTAIGESLSDGGAELLLAGRSERTLGEMAEKLCERQGRQCAYPLVLDLAVAESRRRAAEHIRCKFGRLHGIVNNAYSGRVGPLETIEASDFESACAQNLTGPFHLVQLLLPLLTMSASGIAGGASVVNIASMYGVVSPDPRLYGDKGTNNPVHYGATKAAMIQMTRYLACHLAAKNIRVNSLSPGPFPKPHVAIADPDFVAELSARTPLGRTGLADEVAGPVHFLLSPASSYITGANISVDGGWTAW
jgi:NAD(P)-dependent dehydrogenase (short-subunit alcohol dehydrogenase family)